MKAKICNTWNTDKIFLQSISLSHSSFSDHNHHDDDQQQHPFHDHHSLSLREGMSLVIFKFQQTKGSFLNESRLKVN